VDAVVRAPRHARSDERDRARGHVAGHPVHRARGRPGLFGPDSAIWYVHSHYSTAFGAIATLLMQALEPGMGYAGVNNSKVLSEPFERLGRSASFVIGMTFASRPVTERLTRMVQAMHDHVSGELPDGRPYSANEPHSQRVAAVLFPLGVGAAHRRYHPRPLRGADLDRFVARWAVIDLLAPWARRIYGPSDVSRAQTALARAAVFTAINGPQLIGGDPREVVQARARLRNGRRA
jgi:uncharacterized protein (DUF2236 family)